MSLAKLRIEFLLVAQISREPVDGETAKWIAELDEQLTDRLARLGLVRTTEIGARPVSGPIRALRTSFDAIAIRT
jgi:hypothetical protein